MNALAARRRHPAAIALLILLGLLVTGVAYAALAPKAAQAATANANQVEAGHKLFLANCATCHGMAAQGGKEAPSLAGVGAAAVDFQVGTGRMPLTQPGVQAQQGAVKFSQDETSSMAAYVASLAPGPAVPDSQYTTPTGDAGRGGELFRVNCAMCHNYAGSGGALSRGKYAPAITVGGKYTYEAMVSGPQSMPVFSDNNLSPQGKQDIITYLHAERTSQNPGGLTLGSLGPVPEGLFAWVFGLGALIGCAVWLGAKSA